LKINRVFLIQSVSRSFYDIMNFHDAHNDELIRRQGNTDYQTCMAAPPWLSGEVPGWHQDDGSFGSCAPCHTATIQTTSSLIL
jgi:hypothetical protein